MQGESGAGRGIQRQGATVRHQALAHAVEAVAGGHLVAAAAIVVTLPVLLLTIFIQKEIVVD